MSFFCSIRGHLSIFDLKMSNFQMGFGSLNYFKRKKFNYKSLISLHLSDPIRVEYSAVEARLAQQAIYIVLHTDPAAVSFARDVPVSSRSRALGQARRPNLKCSKNE